MDPNRRAAFQALMDVEERGAYSNLAVNRRLADSRVTAAPFVRELVYGVLRHALWLDYNIDDLYTGSPGKLARGLRVLLRTAFYQMVFMEGTADYAAVNESVQLAKEFYPGREKLVNGILRSFQRRDKVLKVPGKPGSSHYLSVRYSHHPDIVQLWLDAYGPERCQMLLAAGLQIPPLTLRTNSMKTSRKKLMEALRESGFSPTPGSLSETAILLPGGDLTGQELYRQGHCSIQDESSQLAVALLDPGTDDYLLDLCAAPGGKSFASAERRADKGRIDAFDIHPGKVAAMKREADRLSLTSVRIRQGDGRIPRQELAEAADCVWVDAPCSGLGVVRRKPELKLQPLAGMLPDLEALQEALLETAAGYLKKGGRLLYTTCTVNPRENEDRTRAFLEAREDFVLLDQRQLWTGQEEADGFFISLMRRLHD